MNYLFYLGIIIPTIITIVLFCVFIYCWFLQKARKEVLTKKYDPHGKMRRLGIPMDPPPPPAYCRITDRMLLGTGEDNEAYDVSRSPSTEQDARGRPMYHTYHDSGISAGLSPNQENEPRPGLAYRTCPDSGISGFSVQPTATCGQQHQHACRGCCPQVPQELDQQHLQLHQQQRHLQHRLSQFHVHPQSQMSMHQNTVQATVHPTHGVCYGDDMTHPQSPQHYNPPPIQSPPPQFSHSFQTLSSHHLHSQQPLSPQHYTNNISSSNINNHPSSFLGNNSASSTELMDVNSPARRVEMDAHGSQQSQCVSTIFQQNASYFPESPDRSKDPAHQMPLDLEPAIPLTHYPMKQTDIVAAPVEVELHIMSKGMTPSASAHFHPQPCPSSFMKSANTPPEPNQYLFNASNNHMSSSSSFASHPPRHSYRDSGVVDVHPSATGSDRPDSQASQSSTTDSEDSGFRSSHCAAHHSTKLAKQSNPLLKPLRRPKHFKQPKSSLPHRTGSQSQDAIKAGGGGGGSGGGGGGPTMMPLATLSPHNLPSNVTQADVIQTNSMIDVDLAHRPHPRVLQQNVNITNSQSGLLQDASLQNSPTAMTDFGRCSPSSHRRSPSAHHHSPQRENWPTQSVNDQETDIKQNLDMTEISTHLSWKYLQDLSSSPNGECNVKDTDKSPSIHLCRSGTVPSQLSHSAQESSMDILSYSII